jgi:hypothetical protein
MTNDESPAFCTDRCHGCVDCASNVGACVDCGVEAPLTDDVCAACHALPLPGCNCGCNAVPVAVDDDRTTPTPHVPMAEMVYGSAS